MPIPKAIARFNLRVTNPLLGRIAWWAPGFAIVTHVGRSSGTVRRTPVNIFRHDAGYVIALTYGRDSEWVKNVVAAGGCEVETRRRHVRLAGPRLVHDPDGRMVPWFVRIVLQLADVTDYLVLDLAARGAEPARPPAEAP